MPDALSGVVFPLLVLVTWVTVGLAAAVFLGRHGRRSGWWYVIGVVLGPILLPIALELAPRGSTLLTRSALPETGEAPGATVLAALDGSRESDDALDEAVRVLAGTPVRFVLLTVVSPDLHETDPQVQQEAERLLASRTERHPGACSDAVHEVASGDPVAVILDRADADEADLVVLGRRGRGLSPRVLGSVADEVVRRSPRAVLLGPAQPRPKGHVRRG